MAFVHNVNVRNVNAALPQGLRLLAGTQAMSEPSRNGEVRVMPGPVMTIYEQPTERVLFSPVRDANPFFHLFEALWMLAGRNDLPWIVQFNKRFNAYSDDGGLTQPAAYGHRWREYFGYDQLDVIVSELEQNPTSRRAVLAMWDGGRGDHDDDTLGDLERALLGSADIPCNTHCYFRRIGDTLHMTVTCRSNDILWGAYGANAVHFSVMMEYIAASLGLKVGVMYQLSNNYHFYTDVVGDPYAMAQDAAHFDLYATEKLKPMPMFGDVVHFNMELPVFMDWAAADTIDGLASPMFTEAFLREVAVPMRNVWSLHKAKNYARAKAACADIGADDWRWAARAWIERRAKNHRAKSNG